MLNNESTLINSFEDYCSKHNLSTTTLLTDLKIKSLIKQKISDEIEQIRKDDNQSIDYSKDPFVEAAINYFKNPSIARLGK
ncbi:MAG TPA: hypothetical protein PKD85_20310 [Saprospiraceae bacterium]|nr:hypothetical protein [Saprospiraceae bacterium]